MADAHHHGEDRTTFYLDQLFMIGVCGALAAVTLMLWIPASGSLSAKFVQDIQATFGSEDTVARIATARESPRF